LVNLFELYDDARTYEHQTSRCPLNGRLRRHQSWFVRFGEEIHFVSLPGNQAAVKLKCIFCSQNTTLLNLICSYERIKGIFTLMWRSPCGTHLCLFNSMRVNCMQLTYNTKTPSFVFENYVNFMFVTV
jgi:hypothetical protein